MKLYTFIRHTESLYNRDGVSGRDPELTDQGREDATKLSGTYEYALISCMKRARETFELAPNLTASIVEYTSLCREKMSEHFSAPNLMKGEENIGEDEKAFEFRISLLKQFLQYKGKQHDSILIVCHQGVIEAITGERLHNGESIGVNVL